VLLALALGPARASLAASISYGDFGPVPPGVTFQDVQESSGTDPVPLFGPPAPFSVGLDFDPTSFVATSGGGTPDITDGQLNLTLTGSPGVSISSLNLFESGDYTLAGVGTSATQAIAGAILRVTVTQINGLDVAPIILTPSNASVTFDLAANPGVVQPWSLGVALNIAGQLGAGQGATQVEVVIDNQLLALSESSSLAFIAKKDFGIRVETVPEASTVLLLLGALAIVPKAVRRAG
jgi:hypothetical protein